MHRGPCERRRAARAGVAKLVDALGLGPSAARRAGSSPVPSTSFYKEVESSVGGTTMGRTMARSIDCTNPRPKRVQRHIALMQLPLFAFIARLASLFVSKIRGFGRWPK
jgi:hypothetical protein